MSDKQVIIEDVRHIVQIVNEDYPVKVQQDTQVVVVREPEIRIVTELKQGSAGPPGRDADISEDIVLIYQTAKL